MNDNIVDPSMITTLRELGDAWLRLMRHVDLSQRRLADKSAIGEGMVPLPRATIREILQGRRLPSREQLATFLTLVEITDEDELEAWDEAWNRLREQQNRFGSQEITSPLPIGAFLESGPKEAALRQLRRSIPEAAAELEKLGPGSAATILGRWPNEITAEILSAMDAHVAAAILLAHPHIVPVLRKMPLEDAAACLKAMGRLGTVSKKLGWTGPWFLPEVFRWSDDPVLADVNKWRRRKAVWTAAFAAGGVAVISTPVLLEELDGWLNRRAKRNTSRPAILSSQGNLRSK